MSAIASGPAQTATHAATPLLVVMPLWNAGPYVGSAIESILNQSYSGFTLLVINDGSTDDGPEIVKSYRDPRILAWDQANRGPAAVMNRALAFAAESHFPYLARMDADDISLPTRFARQITFLEAREDLAACSANCYYVDEQAHNVIGTSVVPRRARIVRWAIQHGLRGMIQGASMFRTRMLAAVGGYRENLRHAEDTDVFLRLSETYKLANPGEYLYKIRLRSASLSVAEARLNAIYHLYALQCADSRRHSALEPSFADFSVSLNLYKRLLLWREVKLLELWRTSLRAGTLLPAILAAVLDPQRALFRLLRGIA